MKLLALASPPGGALACALLLLGAGSCASSGAQRRGEGDPFWLSTLTLAGEPLLIGGEGPARLVELWASWCAPCGPASEQAQAALGRHLQTRLYAVSIDADPRVLKHALAAAPRPGTQLLLRGGPAEAARLGLNEVPTFIALDRNGVMVGRVTGLSASLPGALEELLSRAEGRPGRPGGA